MRLDKRAQPLNFDKNYHNKIESHNAEESISETFGMQACVRLE
jgi:hypothetical protein